MIGLILIGLAAILWFIWLVVKWAVLTILSGILPAYRGRKLVSSPEPTLAAATPNLVRPWDRDFKAGPPPNILAPDFQRLFPEAPPRETPAAPQHNAPAPNPPEAAPNSPGPRSRAVAAGPPPSVLTPVVPPTPRRETPPPSNPPAPANAGASGTAPQRKLFRIRSSTPANPPMSSRPNRRLKVNGPPSQPKLCVECRTTGRVLPDSGEFDWRCGACNHKWN